MVSVAHTNAPTSRLAASLILNIQLPFASAGKRPLKVESGISGLKVPANGGVPLVILVAALSSNIVLP
jgi:hypothetical protein